METAGSSETLIPIIKLYRVTSQRIFFLICIVGGGIQGPLDTAANNGLLCQPRVIMMMEKSVE
jgi:hypothetical protein